MFCHGLLGLHNYIGHENFLRKPMNKMTVFILNVLKFCMYNLVGTFQDVIHNNSPSQIC